MPLGALGLVLIAALCHSTWNLLLKTEPRRLQVQSGALATGVLLASPVLLFYSLDAISPTAWLLIALSALFETGYVFALSAAYGVGDLSLVYPIARGTAPLVVSPLAVALLGERLSGPGLAGIALVVLGIWLSHLGAPSRQAGAPTGHPGHEGRRALALAVFTGLMTAGYSLVNKVGVASIGPTKAQLTERPFSAPPAPSPLTARTTSVSPEFLPERSIGPEAWARPDTPANKPRRSPRPGAAQAPSVVAGLGVGAGAPGGARPASSRDAAARIAPIASGSSTVAISRSRPPQRGHASTSTSNTRRISAAHAQWRGADPEATGASEHGLATASGPP
jgi:multidrug transporter EmrE-like cation transporter